MSLVDCIDDVISDARESINLADGLLAEFRALLDSGDLRESDERDDKSGEV